MIFDEKEYEFIMGSDIIRDGMYLEVNQSNKNPLLQVAEVFYSDVDGKFYLTTYVDNVPLPLIEELIKRAKNRLLPK